MNPIKILDRLSSENNLATSYIIQHGHIVAVSYYNEKMKLQINLNYN